MATQQASGSAARWGPLWGARASDWAEVEEQQIEVYEEAIRHVELAPGQRALDVGCGSGVFLQAAAERGAETVGIDASEALVEVARARVPDAEVRVGDMQHLPFEDDSFDLVCGFTSFFFADDLTAALREAGRVAKPGAQVVVQVWGDPGRCDIEAMKALIRPYFPASPPGTPQPPPLWQAGVLESFAAAAGLTPRYAFDKSWAYEFADDAALVRAMLSAGGISELLPPAELAGFRRTIVDTLAPYRTTDGGYRLENESHYLIASA